MRWCGCGCRRLPFHAERERRQDPSTARFAPAASMHLGGTARWHRHAPLATAFAWMRSSPPRCLGRPQWGSRGSCRISAAPGDCRNRERHQQPPVLAARVLAHAVVAGTGVALQPAERERVQRRPAPLRPRLCIPHQLDRPRLGERPRCLLAVMAAAAIHHDEPRTAPIDTGEPGPLKGQPGSLLPRCQPVATPERSATARKPLW
jgi:hypothetical protein